MKSTTSLSDACENWFSTLTEAAYASNTLRSYRSAIRCHVIACPIGGLPLCEANTVPMLEPWLHDIAQRRGRGAALVARKVVSGALHHAVRYGAIDHSVIAQVRLPRGSERRQQRAREADRALTPRERDDIVVFARNHWIARRHDLADLVAFMAGTGVRISEALDMRWRDFDWQETVRAHVHGTKTVSSDRVMPLPGWLANVMRARRHRFVDAEPHHVVFTSVRHSDLTKPRNLHDTERKLRHVFDDAGLAWATSHTFRHTAITRIVEAGYDIGLAADFAGHASVKTTQLYIGRRRDITALASVL